MVFFVVIIFSPIHPFIWYQNDNVIINVNKKNSCTVQTKNCLLKWEYFAINFLSCYLLATTFHDRFIPFIEFWYAGFIFRIHEYLSWQFVLSSNHNFHTCKQAIIFHSFAKIKFLITCDKFNVRWICHFRLHFTLFRYYLKI